MKSFAQFLTETPKVVDLSQFPVIMSNPASQEQIQNPRFVMNRYVKIANAAIQTGGVLKSGYKDLSSTANDVAEYAARLIDAKYKHAGRWENLPKELQEFEIRPNHIGLVSSTLAKTEKLRVDHPYRTEAIAMLHELLPVEALVGYFKTHIVVKLSKSEKEAEAAYAAPQSTKNAKKLVADVLTHMTNEVKSQYIIQIEEPWTEAVSEFFAKNHAEQLRSIGAHPDQDEERHQRNIAGRAKHKTQYGKSWGFKEETRGLTFIERALLPVVSTTTRIGEVNGVIGWNSTNNPMHDKLIWTLRPNWKQLLHKKAEDQANDMQAQFVSKNVAKLTFIVETKGNIEGNPTILNVHCQQGVIEGNIKFQFKDSSAFTVRNKIVSKMYEARDGQYATMYQYPTTFHNASLPNGKRMEGQPSEKQMNEIFAVAKG